MLSIAYFIVINLAPILPPSNARHRPTDVYSPITCLINLPRHPHPPPGVEAGQSDEHPDTGTAAAAPRVSRAK